MNAISISFRHFISNADRITAKCNQFAINEYCDGRNWKVQTRSDKPNVFYTCQNPVAAGYLPNTDRQHLHKHASQ